MSTELARVEDAPLGLDRVRERVEFSPDQKQLIKDTLCRGATDDELRLFLWQCERLQLDPLAKQIHAVKRWDSDLKREVMTSQVGVDGFRLVAERTGCYLPGRPTTYEYDPQGNLASATAYILRWARGEWHEVAETAFYEEYVQLKRDNTPNSMWTKMPRSQLGKCAECRALRRAFPNDLSGVYSPEEMGQAENAEPYARYPTAGVQVRQPAPRALAQHNGVTADATTGEVIDERKAMIDRYGVVKARVKALGGKVPLLSREMTAQDIRDLLGAAEEILAELEAAAAKADADHAELDQQMDQAADGDKDPFAEDA